MELKCNFKAASKPQTYGQEGKTLTKFYVDIDPQSNYPSVGEFTFFGDKVSLEGIKAGDPITVHFNISGRKAEWTDKTTGQKKSGFFQTLVAWKVEAETVAEPAPAVDNVEPLNENEDDLPF